MSNRVIVKFGFIATMFVFASCPSKMPDFPSPASDYKWCGYKDKDGTLKCESTYKVSEANCTKINGNLFSDKDCKVPYKEPGDEPDEE